LAAGDEEVVLALVSAAGVVFAGAVDSAAVAVDVVDSAFSSAEGDAPLDL
jgi:hypothetical protein